MQASPGTRTRLIIFRLSGFDFILTITAAVFTLPSVARGLLRDAKKGRFQTPNVIELGAGVTLDHQVVVMATITNPATETRVSNM